MCIPCLSNALPMDRSIGAKRRNGGPADTAVGHRSDCYFFTRMILQALGTPDPIFPVSVA